MQKRMITQVLTGLEQTVYLPVLGKLRSVSGTWRGMRFYYGTSRSLVTSKMAVEKAEDVGSNSGKLKRVIKLQRPIFQILQVYGKRRNRRNITWETLWRRNKELLATKYGWWGMEWSWVQTPGRILGIWRLLWFISQNRKHSSLND